MGALMVGGAVRAPFRIAAACARFVGLMPRVSNGGDAGHRLAAKERELDLPPLPDIPDDVPPDTYYGNDGTLFIFSCGRIAVRLFLLLFCELTTLHKKHQRAAMDSHAQRPLHRAVRHGGDDHRRPRAAH